MNFEDFKGHIYLIDDDPSIRRSLAFSLSSLRYSIQSFENPKAFLKDSLSISPAVILLDNRMPETSGLSLQNESIHQGRVTPIIFISGESHPPEIIEALKKGAVDFLLKPFGLHALVQAIDLALEKDKTGLDQRMKIEKARQRFSSLTDKEREICGWMIKGFGNKEIANLNGSAASTVKLHRSRVLEKMGCTSLSELLDLTMDGDRRLLNIYEPPRSATASGLTGQRRMANTGSADIVAKPSC